MNYLIDTNIISEVRKGRRCDPNVARWYEKIEDTSLYLSVLVIGEIRNGIEKVRPKDTAKANALEQWLIAHHFVMRADTSSRGGMTTADYSISLAARREPRRR